RALLLQSKPLSDCALLLERASVLFSEFRVQIVLCLLLSLSLSHMETSQLVRSLNLYLILFFILSLIQNLALFLTSFYKASLFAFR
ncbi:unnamed protein product, partial [Prunus brigantina]